MFVWWCFIASTTSFFTYVYEAVVVTLQWDNNLPSIKAATVAFSGCYHTALSTIR